MKKDGAFVVLFKNSARQEVFLVRRSDIPIWGLTGGGMEKGEKPKESALREAGEETGFRVKILRRVGTYIFPSRRTYLFEGRIISGKFRPEFPGCLGKWFSLSHLPDDSTPRTRDKIFDTVNRHSRTPFQKIVQETSFALNFRIFFHHPYDATKFYFSRWLKSRLK